MARNIDEFLGEFASVFRSHVKYAIGGIGEKRRFAIYFRVRVVEDFPIRDLFNVQPFIQRYLDECYSRELNPRLMPLNLCYTGEEIENSNDIAIPLAVEINIPAKIE